MTRGIWILVGAVFAVMTAAGVVLGFTTLERSNQWASVISMFIGAASLVVALLSFWLAFADRKRDRSAGSSGSKYRLKIYGGRAIVGDGTRTRIIEKHVHGDGSRRR
jgi:threonine/homoserine/homoserine lactone efflux protein